MDIDTLMILYSKDAIQDNGRFGDNENKPYSTQFLLILNLCVV